MPKIRVYSRKTKVYSRIVEDIYDLYDYGYYHGDAYDNYTFDEFKSSFLIRLRFLRKYHKGEGKMLDVGCALGFFAKIAQDDGFDAYGVDISEYAVQEGKKVLGDKILFANVEKKIPFPDAFFDVITAWDVLEHVKKPAEFLKIASRVMKENGLIVIRTLNYDCLTARLMGKSWLQIDPLHVSYTIRITDLKKWLAGAGFEVMEISTQDIYLKPFPKRIKMVEKLLRYQVLIILRLLKPFNLGDDIVCVARKLPSPSNLK